MFISIYQAFGTMGILFPLVIPTICELEAVHGGQCRADVIVQAAAAIMASSIFGNGMENRGVWNWYKEWEWKMH